MFFLIICFIVLFLLSKIFEKALVLDIDLGENKDLETGNDVEEMFDTVISLVQENNKTLEWVANNMVYSEPGEVTDLIEELNDLINEQRDSIKKIKPLPPHVHSSLLEQRSPRYASDNEEDLVVLEEKKENLDDDGELKTTIIDNYI
ncbi:2911_t:CDS:2, partial [Dentiscutata erythropus]